MPERRAELRVIAVAMARRKPKFRRSWTSQRRDRAQASYKLHRRTWHKNDRLIIHIQWFTTRLETDW